MTPITDLALFPLNTVLFPDGVLPLRVFETRYVDMVRECLRGDRPFGVARILAGHESTEVGGGVGGGLGGITGHESVGCLARIVDVDQAEPGVLAVRTVGLGRFHIDTTRVTSAGLIRFDGQAIAVDPVIAVPAALQDCVPLAQRILAELERQEPDPSRSHVVAPYRFDDCGWLANRLGEILPLPTALRQTLMAEPDPVMRLAALHGRLREQGFFFR